jgi:hypothetical protein
MSSISIVIGGERKNGTMLVVIGVVIGVGEAGRCMCQWECFQLCCGMR